MKKRIGEVKAKKILLVVLSLVILSSLISFTSANSAVACMGCTKTLVNGIIYNGHTGEPIEGADISVTCKDNHRARQRDNTITGIKSLEDGTYFVVFDSIHCDEDDTVIVSATKDGVSGENQGKVHDNVVGSLDVAVVNVPLVPEFGFVIGGLTVLGALGAFFIVRKK